MYLKLIFNLRPQVSGLLLARGVMGRWFAVCITATAFSWWAAPADASEARQKWSSLQELKSAASYYLEDQPDEARWQWADETGVAALTEKQLQDLVLPHFSDWRSANKAMGAALNAGDRPTAALAARAAVAHYKTAQDYDPNTHVVLISNAYDLIAGQSREGRARSSYFLFSEIEHIYETGSAITKSVVELANTFGLIGEVAFFWNNVQIRMGLPRNNGSRIEWFWKETVKAAEEIFGESAEPTLLARYYRLSYARYSSKLYYRRKGLSKLADEAVEAKALTPAVLAMSGWLNIALTQGKTEKAMARLEEFLHVDLADMQIPKGHSTRLIGMIVAGYFLKHGAEKTEALISSLARDEKFASISDDPYDFNFNPIRRIEPRFMNILRPEQITLEFDVDADGAVVEETIEILETTSKRLNKPAKDAVAQWRYRPPLVDGKFQPQEGIKVAFSVVPP